MALGGAFGRAQRVAVVLVANQWLGYAVGTFAGLLAALLVPFGPKIAQCWFKPCLRSPNCRRWCGGSRTCH